MQSGKAQFRTFPLYFFGYNDILLLTPIKERRNQVDGDRE
jgi:hypothetical protein